MQGLQLGIQGLSLRKNNIYILSALKKLNSVLFGVLSTVALNRALSPSLRGEYELIYASIVTLAVILHLGISTVFPYFYRKQKEGVPSTFTAIFFLQFGVYLFIGMLIALLLASWNFVIWTLALCMTILSTQLANLCIVTDYKASFTANTAGVIGNAALLLGMWVFYPNNLTVAFLCFIAKETMISLICLTSILPKFRYSEVVWGRVWRIIRSGSVPMLTNLLIILNYRVDVFILGILEIESSEIGIYAVGLALAQYGWLVPDIFKEVVINRTARDDNLDAIAFSCRLSSSAMLSIWLIIVFFANDILALLYGNAYSAGGTVTIIIFAGAWSMVYTKLLGVLWLAKGQWGFYFNVLLFCVIASVVANFVLVPRFEIYGAAVSTTVAYTFAGVSFLMAFSRKYGFKIRDLVFVNRHDLIRIRSFLRP